MLQRNELYIDGKWVPASGSASTVVVNPVTEEPFAQVTEATIEDVALAVAAAHDALPEWSRTPVSDRAAALKKLSELTLRRAPEIAETVVEELGYPAAYAHTAHAEGAVEDLRSVSDSLTDINWAEQVGPTAVVREAAGVVGAITPWNGPLRMVCMKAGAAMAAGCTVVLKGTEVAPLTSFIFAEIVEEAGLPPGVFNLISGTGPVVGEALVTHPLVDMVSLTGSVRAGRRVMELAAQSIKKVSLELGGKSANVILDDAPLELAVVDGIEDAFRNTGQACGALTRMLVPRSRLAEAEELAATKANSYVLGDPHDPATTLGPVANAAQHTRVRNYIQLGIDEGARLVAGGPDLPAGVTRGYFVRPTIFTADNSYRIAREEIFGPVITIIPFDDEEEAFRIANDSVYGLAGSIWAGDPARARKMADKLRVGRIRINGSRVNQRAPHGGFKRSGIGREFGRYGIEEFLEYKSIG